MQMTPKYYFDHFVKENYDDFLADQGSIRKAFNALVSLVHMTDNYFNYYRYRKDVRVNGFEKVEAYQICLSKLTPYFNDVQSMANAYKHLYLNTGKTHVTVASGGAVFVREAVAGDESLDEDGDLDEVYLGTVYYMTKNGECRDVDTALREVVRMWETIFIKDEN